MPSERSSLTLGDREIDSATPVVKDHAGLSKSWSNRERAILKISASFEEVDRIFVSPWIKRDLWTLFRGEEWIAKIRPWWGHEDHFHIRLKCPIESRDCVSQAPVPAGDGCDSTLDWWFSEEPSLVAMKRKKDPENYSLPIACESLLEK